MKKYLNIPTYASLVISIILAVLYRQQLLSNPAYQEISILGQRISTSTTAIIFGIIFVILFIACSSLQKGKLFLTALAVSGIYGLVLAMVLSYGKYGEANLIQVFLPITYLIVACIISLVVIVLRTGKGYRF